MPNGDNIIIIMILASERFDANNDVKIVHKPSDYTYYIYTLQIDTYISLGCHGITQKSSFFSLQII